MKKVGIYNPYLDILGGGERYCLTIAQCLSKDFQVDVFWKDPKILKKAEEKFHLNLSRIGVKRWFASPVTRATQLRSYDVLFYVTDGSLFFSTAKKSFLIIQSPDKIPLVKPFFMKAKLATWKFAICYSQFMKRIIEKSFTKKVVPLFVPIDPTLFTKRKKEKIILSVGRFFPHLHNKKQNILIDVFKKVSPQLRDWKLILVGSVDPGNKGYFRTLKKQTDNFPIEFYTDISFISLSRLYEKASIYWHGAGFGEDLVSHPEKAEHFGVTTVEAMIANCVPIVFASGGQKEIVEDGKNGYMWETKEELIRKTKLIISNKEKYQYLAQKAYNRAQKFTVHKFCSKVHELVEK